MYVPPHGQRFPGSEQRSTPWSEPLLSSTQADPCRKPGKWREWRNRIRSVVFPRQTITRCAWGVGKPARVVVSPQCPVEPLPARTTLITADRTLGQPVPWPSCSSAEVCWRRTFQPQASGCSLPFLTNKRSLVATCGSTWRPFSNAADAVGSRNQGPPQASTEACGARGYGFGPMGKSVGSVSMMAATPLPQSGCSNDPGVTGVAIIRLSLPGAGPLTPPGTLSKLRL